MIWEALLIGELLLSVDIFDSNVWSGCFSHDKRLSFELVCDITAGTEGFEMGSKFATVSIGLSLGKICGFTLSCLTLFGSCLCKSKELSILELVVALWGICCVGIFDFKELECDLEIDSAAARAIDEDDSLTLFHVFPTGLCCFLVLFGKGVGCFCGI